VRRLQGRPPVSDPFGVAGRRWLAGLELPDDEHETVADCLRHVDFLDAGQLGRRGPNNGEVAGVERALDIWSRWRQHRRAASLIGGRHVSSGWD
jgi:hypothetical protein